jgi:hypothetical protein
LHSDFAFSVDDQLLTGNLAYWKLGSETTENLRVAPFYTQTADEKPFNQLFAAAYDLILCRCERMGHLAPSPERDIKAIFKEKVFGTECFLVSAETIAYLKWLIYTAVFKDGEQRDKVGGELGHALYYLKELQTLQDPDNQHWRVALRRELEAWYAAHPPIGKRRKSQGPSTIAVDPALTRKWGNAELYVDSDAEELEDPNDAVAAGRALAAAAAASAAGP